MFKSKISWGLLIAAVALLVFFVFVKPSQEVSPNEKEVDIVNAAPTKDKSSASLFKSIQTDSDDVVARKKQQSQSGEKAIDATSAIKQASTEDSPDQPRVLIADEIAPKPRSDAGIQIKNEVMQGEQRHQRGTQFTKVAFSGETMPDDAGVWDCARDKKTQLLWETKLYDAGVSDTENTYSWNSPGHEFPGHANGGRCFGVRCDTFSYTREMNRINLCGSSEWRVPTFDELQTLLDRDYFNPTLNQDIFQHSQSGAYWTSTRLKSDPNMVMQINFFNGTSSPAPIRYTLSLRLVSP